MLYDSLLYQQDIDYCTEYPLNWNLLNNSSLLISGASGMIGSFMVDVLMRRNERHNSNVKVFALARDMASLASRFTTYLENPLFHIIAQDINMPLQSDCDFDYIIHAASNTHPIAYASNPISTITTNVIGAHNLLDYAVHHKVKRFMYLSSVEVYGENRGDKDKFDERYCGYIDCNTLRAGYPESKRVGEALCNAYTKEHGVDIVIPRLCRIYGPTMRTSDSKALAQFIKKSVEKQDIVLKSTGNQLFSYCYTADSATALFSILLSGTCGEAYNISDDGSNATLKELAEILAKIAGTRVVFDLPDATESAGYSKAQLAVLDNSKITVLGWRAKYKIKEGIRRTVDILRQI